MFRTSSSRASLPMPATNSFLLLLSSRGLPLPCGFVPVQFPLGADLNITAKRVCNSCTEDRARSATTRPTTKTCQKHYGRWLETTAASVSQGTQTCTLREP
uniref:Putative secreted protein n=1 Tax=Ixodes ricinus TaxID=34613 RepID=A0A6B0U8U1_IXORI